MLKDGSFILAGRSFQIVGPETLNDLGPNVIVLVLGRLVVIVVEYSHVTRVAWKNERINDDDQQNFERNKIQSFFAMELERCKLVGEQEE